MSEAVQTEQEAPRDKRERVRRPRIYAGVLALIAATLLIGGVQLALLGGSLYYVLAGAALGACVFLLWTGRSEGALGAPREDDRAKRPSGNRAGDLPQHESRRIRRSNASKGIGHCARDRDGGVGERC
jgi:hypothetical protein